LSFSAATLRGTTVKVVEYLDRVKDACPPENALLRMLQALWPGGDVGTGRR
jgi:hypothetical protein